MPSLISRAMPTVVRLRGAKKVFSSAEAVRKQALARSLRPTGYAPPPGLERTVDLAVRRVAGWPVYDVTPHGDRDSGRRAIYLHGGAYINEIAPQHWKLIAQVAVETGTRVTVPIYPLAPLATAAEVVPAVTDLAAEILGEGADTALSLIGDSAGGGMALAVAVHLRDRGQPAPARTILISPWLDISLTDPRIALLEDRDPWLAVPGARYAGDLYRGALPIDHPHVSPLLADLTGLNPITLFSGTHDIVNADARRLAARATAAGVELDFHEAPEMLHVYPLLPIPEGRAARAALCAALLS
ncbi:MULTISPECIES: alpha/beta hydrolase fold domain-containing protein [unclassified Streptomyces]|uniref:alpha/beta hydrolase fold domain-containing protein n=1 Tax=unclassified Streptomyces TaxID=2593676 RepID=UPI000E308297|nr:MULTISPECIES: alpha/beta hydrolase fold domain-containing protein [unclassified Streptomyces]MCX5441893.1 alpha/beta hydrolase [Streptomyces sp. NBC_00063]RFC70294.1 steryl acetyl hydrolase [Streptomyces sp. AcE210]WSE19090.1 alpha/beta hydrolase [Streptomyces sp. NBC_01397]